MKSLRKRSSAKRSFVFQSIVFGASYRYNRFWELGLTRRHKGSIQQTENAFSLPFAKFGWDGCIGWSTGRPFSSRQSRWRRTLSNHLRYQDTTQLYLEHGVHPYYTTRILRCFTWILKWVRNSLNPHSAWIHWIRSESRHPRYGILSVSLRTDSKT